MAGEVTFKTKAAPPAPKAHGTTNVKTGPIQSVPTDTVEVPYLDYEKSHGEPHAVSYFEMGSRWSDPTGGFPKEVEAIEGYFREQIESGEIANSTDAVKRRMKEILKVTNMTKEERKIIKIETVAAYVKFLRDTDDIKHSVKRYGNAQ